MYVEIAGFVSLIVLAFFAFASYFKLPPLGIIATVLLFVLGAWIMIDNVQFKSGEMTTTTTISPCPDSCQAALNVSTMTTTTMTNETYVYSNPPPTPFADWNYVIGFIMILISIYSGFLYVFVPTD